MTQHAMPGPARLVSSSTALLIRKGYTRDGARKAIKDVVEAMASGKDDWAPWQLDWWRKLWHEANGSGAATKPARPSPGRGNSEHRD